MRGFLKRVSPRKAVFTMIAALGIIFGLSIFLSGHERDLLIEEGGIVESMTVILYSLCAVQILYFGGYSFQRKYYYFVTIVVLMGLRELDFHSRFTSMGIFKARFYTTASISPVEKLIGFSVIAYLIWIAVALFRYHRRDFILEFKDRSLLSFCILGAACLVAVSKTLDGLSRKLKSIGVSLKDQDSMHFTALEEVMELGIPIALILSFHIYFQRKQAAALDPTPIG
jgi:hypothetical protein